MPINLSKGQKVDLTKGNPGLTKIMVVYGVGAVAPSQKMLMPLRKSKVTEVQWIRSLLLSRSMP